MFHVASSQINMSMPTPMVLFIRVALVLRWSDGMTSCKLNTFGAQAEYEKSYNNRNRKLVRIAIQNFQKPFGMVITLAKATLPYT